MSSGSDTEDAGGRRLAEELVVARRQGRLIAPRDRPAPMTVEAAMRVQAATLSLLGVEHKGWKVALGPGRTAVAAPLPDIRFGMARPVAYFPAIRIEIEFCFRLSADLSPDPSQPLDRDRVMALSDAVFLGVEIVGGRFAEPQSLPFELLLADNLANVSYLVGPRVDPSDLENSAGQSCRITCAGEPICDVPARHPDDDPTVPLLAYANRPKDFLGGLKQGQIVTTGSLCGAVRLPAPGRVVATVGGLPPLAFDVV